MFIPDRIIFIYSTKLKFFQSLSPFQTSSKPWFRISLKIVVSARFYRCSVTHRNRRRSTLLVLVRVLVPTRISHKVPGCVHRLRVVLVRSTVAASPGKVVHSATSRLISTTSVRPKVYVPQFRVTTQHPCAGMNYINEPRIAWIQSRFRCGICKAW